MKGIVYVVDDDEAVRRSLSDVLSAEGLDVKTLGSAEELLAACDERSTGCIVLDIRLPGLDGIGAQTLLSQRHIEMPIIFLTGHGDVPMSVRAMKAGAYDFLQKPVSADTLLARVYGAMRLDQQRNERRAEIEAAQDRLAQLTGREIEVLRFLLQGASSKEIARHLDLSPRTVDVHRKNILIKCRAASLLELSAVYHLSQGAE